MIARGYSALMLGIGFVLELVSNPDLIIRLYIAKPLLFLYNITGIIDRYLKPLFIVL